MFSRGGRRPPGPDGRRRGSAAASWGWLATPSGSPAESAGPLDKSLAARRQSSSCPLALAAATTATSCVGRRPWDQVPSVAAVVADELARCCHTLGTSLAAARASADEARRRYAASTHPVHSACFACS